MRRREFIAALGGVAAWPLTTQAQQSDREKRVGVLMLYTDHDPDGQARLLAFQRALTEQGWPNAQIDARWGFGSIERLRSGALELIADKVDVIWTLGMEP